MSCKNIQKQLPLYVGNDLPWLKKLIVENHLKHCDACRAELLTLKKSHGFFVQTMLEKTWEMDSFLWDKVQHRLPEREKIRRKVATNRWIKSGFRFSLGLAVLLILFSVQKPKHIVDLPLPIQQNPLIARDYPIVENVNKSGVTVMTFETQDPKIIIVWFFEEENAKNKEI